MRYFIYGYYGFGNFGDDLMLSAIISQTRRRDPRASFTVKCRDAVPGLGDDVAFLQADRILERDAPAWRRAIAYGATLWHSLQGHDWLIVGGGALFLDKGRINKSLLFLLLLVWRARLGRIPLALVGVSCDQLANPLSLWLTRAIFRHARWIAVRDVYSLDYARYFGREDAALCADLAFASPELTKAAFEAQAPNKPPGRRRVGICLVDYFATYELDAHRRTLFLARIAASLCAHAPDTDYVYLSLQTGQGLRDEQLYEELSNDIAFLEHRSIRSVDEAMAAIRSIDGIVTMRYHLGLLAHAVGVPVVSIGHEMKMVTLSGRGVATIPLAQLSVNSACDPVAALGGIVSVPVDWATLRREAEANFAWCAPVESGDSR